jgi:hypothetical protein
MPRIGSFATAVMAILAACTPTPSAPVAPSPAAPARDTAAADTTSRLMLRPLVPPSSFRSAVQSGTRTTTGQPGPGYWQQRVRYRIEAELNPRTAVLRGAGRIHYQNQSPDTLTSIVLNLYQNVFSEGVPRNRFAPITGGITLDRVAASGRTLRQLSLQQIPVETTPGTGAPPGYAIRGTLARVVLPRPIAPGDSAVLEMEWHHKVPPAGAFRTAWQDTLGGRAFQVAQWYPQVATYDDLRGWDTTPYLGDGEFYLEYGDYDVSITVPAGYLVGATGVLQNADEVLTDEARRRLASALRSDSITRVVTEADLEANNATQPAEDRQLTWRFRAADVRDFAFATSGRYVWDATRAQVPDTAGGMRVVAVHALYRPGATHWGGAARYGQHSTEFFSRLLIPYLYPQITIAEGSVGGMEYPQLVFIGKPSTEEALYNVIAHEVAHEWFPMMVGQDEAAYAWMDEGTASYYDAAANGDFFRTADPFAADRAAYLRVAGTEAEVPMMRHTDLVSPYGARTVAAYRKPGTLLRSLRAILGEDVFQRAMTTYAQEWLLKHPTPWDFFNTMERVSGRELDWFFYPWWFETGTLDQAVERVEVVDTGTVRVTVRDRGDIPAPTLLRATTASGATITTQIPVETWLAGTRTATAAFQVSEPVVRIEVDPEELFPDINRDNNVWTAAVPATAVDTRQPYGVTKPLYRD